MMEDRAANAMRPSLRILAVALDSLGDMVLREPLFDALASGGHQLTLVVRQGQGAVGHLVGHDAQVLELPFNPYKTDWPTCEPLLIQWMESIDLARFDVLLSTQFDRTHVDAALALRMPSARHVRFVHAAELHGDEAYGATPRWVAVASRDEHEWTKASRLAHAVLGDIEWRAPILAVSADARREAESFLAQWLLRADAFVVCCPSSTSNDLQKRMPAQLAADGLTELYSKYLFPALLVGLPHEGDDLRAVAEILMKRGTPVAIWMGDPQRPDLLAAIIEQSRCFFGIDGGSMHVAAALRKPVLAVLGGGHYPRFTPVVEPSYLMTQRLPCFDCAWKCWLQRPACIDLVFTGSRAPRCRMGRGGKRRLCRRGSVGRRRAAIQARCTGPARWRPRREPAPAPRARHGQRRSRGAPPGHRIARSAG
jgi:ADP-heptose:LPS heptosyltransferase